MPITLGYFYVLLNVAFIDDDKHAINSKCGVRRASQPLKVPYMSMN